MAITNCPDHVAQSVECGASIVETKVQFALGRTIFNQPSMVFTQSSTLISRKSGLKNEAIARFLLHTL